MCWSAGPALCIALPGVEVTPQELSDLMTGAAGAEGGVRVRGHAPSVGLGLLGAFTVTEVSHQLRRVPAGYVMVAVHRTPDKTVCR